MNQNQIAKNLQKIAEALRGQEQQSQQSFTSAFVGVVNAFKGGEQLAINTSVGQLYDSLPEAIHNQDSLEALLFLVPYINLRELQNDTQAATAIQTSLNRVTTFTDLITQYLMHPKDPESFISGLSNIATFIKNGLDSFPGVIGGGSFIPASTVVAGATSDNDVSTPRERVIVATIERANKIDRAAMQDEQRRPQDHQLNQMLSIALSNAVSNPGTAINNASSPANGRPGR